MKRILTGLIFGLIAGIIDIIPMIIQKLEWSANISALTFWIVNGFLISVIDLKINALLKGILISFIALIPIGIIIGWDTPMTLIPISAMTLCLGSLLGFFIGKFNKK